MHFSNLYDHKWITYIYTCMTDIQTDFWQYSHIKILRKNENLIFIWSKLKIHESIIRIGNFSRNINFTRFINRCWISISQANLRPDRLSIEYLASDITSADRQAIAHIRFFQLQGILQVLFIAATSRIAEEYAVIDITVVWNTLSG